MRLFGYPYNNDLVICKDRSDYLIVCYLSVVMTSEDAGWCYYKSLSTKEIDFVFPSFYVNYLIGKRSLFMTVMVIIVCKMIIMVSIKIILKGL